MAPSVGLLKFRRDDDDDDLNFDDGENTFENSGNPGGFGNSGISGNSGKSNSGSTSSKPPSFPQPPPFKVITHQVTVTSTDVQTSVQTSVVFLSTSSPSTSAITFTTPSATTSTINTSVTNTSTNTTSSTGAPSTPQTPKATSTSETSSSSSAATPLTSSADLNSPSNPQDASPGARPMSLGMKTPLPVASIISIILGCLFFITLCLVIYVRNPRIPKRVSGYFRRRRNASSSRTISSFEPKEIRARDYHQDTFGRPARSFTFLSELHAAPGPMEVHRGVYSPQNPTRGLLTNAAPHGTLSLTSVNTYSPESSRETSLVDQLSEIPPSRTISVFDEYEFEHDFTDPRPGQENWRNTVHSSSGFPQSVHETTVE